MGGQQRQSLLRRNILVVENEGLIAMLYRDLLQKWGFNVMGPAGSLKAALALLKNELPDAAILDVQLDGDTSEPIAAALKANNRPFVVTTGHTLNSISGFLAQAPILRKPIDAAELKSVLTALLPNGSRGTRRPKN